MQYSLHMSEKTAEHSALTSNNQVITLGCRLNTYESEVIKDLSHQSGLKDAIIINTCAVTAEAERQARQIIRKFRRENPTSKIIVTGCGAQINPEQYAAMPEVTSVIGNDEKMKIATYQSLSTNQNERILVNNIMSVKETAGHLVSGFEGKARAFVQVQNGCDHRCTFCTIPYGRGNSRSVAMGEIVEQVRSLVNGGYQEVVITGVDITSYGGDLPGNPTLGQMLKRLLALVPELPRLRLSSVDPVEIDEDLWRLISDEERLMPHLHLSLQAGDDMILKRMKRRHLRHDAIEFCKRARFYRPDVAFGADLIAGFPTETDEMFLNTCRIVDECDLTYLHVFPYSARSHTPASRMPQVPSKIIKERASKLRQVGKEALHRFFDHLLNKETTALVEHTKNGFVMGKTDHFAPIRIEEREEIYTPGTLHQVKVVGRNDEELQGIFI